MSGTMLTRDMPAILCVWFVRAGIHSLENLHTVAAVDEMAVEEIAAEKNEDKVQRVPWVCSIGGFEHFCRWRRRH